MKRFETKKILCVMMAVLMLCSFAGCKKKSKAKATEETAADPTPVPVTTAAPTATTLPIYSGPLESGLIEVTWTETEITATVKYAAISQGEFLRVRQGPDTGYDIVGMLTRNQEVTVVAQTGNGWFKTIDGFYVSGTYLTDTPSA